MGRVGSTANLGSGGIRSGPGQISAPGGRAIGTPGIAGRAINTPEVMGFGAMSAEEPALQGRTVTLRPLTEADFDSWREVWERNADVLRETGASAPEDADFQRSVEQYQAASNQGLAYQFGIFEGDKFVGEASIDGIVGGTLANGMVGVWVDRQEAGRGAGADAFVQLCRFAFEEVGLHRLEAAALPGNEAVTAAFDRLGIRNEGIAERYRLVDGEWRDHVRYAITAEEWQERRDELMTG